MLMLERTEALNQMIIDFAHEVGAGRRRASRPPGVLGKQPP